MEEITELHPVQNVPELSTSTQTPIRCISSVARRHSLDIDGSLISSCVSEARTPRPNINEEDPLEHVQERDNSRHHIRSFSDSWKHTWRNISMIFSP